jgi:hypothetical protein
MTKSQNKTQKKHFYRKSKKLCLPSKKSWRVLHWRPLTFCDHIGQSAYMKEKAPFTAFYKMLQK